LAAAQAAIAVTTGGGDDMAARRTASTKPQVTLSKKEYRARSIERQSSIVDTTLFVSIREACHILGIGRTTLYALMARGDVVSARRGGRRLVSSASLRAYHDRLIGG